MKEPPRKPALRPGAAPSALSVEGSTCSEQIHAMMILIHHQDGSHQDAQGCFCAYSAHPDPHPHPNPDLKRVDPRDDARRVDPLEAAEHVETRDAEVGDGEPVRVQRGVRRGQQLQAAQEVLGVRGEVDARRHGGKPHRPLRYLPSWTMAYTRHPCDATLDYTIAIGRVTGRCNYPQRPPGRDVTLTTAMLSLALIHATRLTLATLALALALAALAALALTVPSRTSRPGSSSTNGMWNSKKGLPHRPSSRYNCRAHTDAASVSVLSARGRPSRGALETGSHTTAAGSNPNAITRPMVFGSSTDKGSRTTAGDCPIYIDVGIPRGPVEAQYRPDPLDTGRPPAAGTGTCGGTEAGGK